MDMYTSMMEELQISSVFHLKLQKQDYLTAVKAAALCTGELR